MTLSAISSAAPPPLQPGTTFWRFAATSADSLLAVETQLPVARWANRFILVGLILFAIALPHSIAGAHLGLNLSWLAWIVRDVALKKLHFRRTPLDKPLLCFAALTVLSSLCSVEPAISLPKLKSLLLFGVLYLVTTNLRPAATKILLPLLLISSLTGVAFSLAEKAYGRGLVIQAINPASPLRPTGTASLLQPGDAIWMIAKRRVYSLSQANRYIQEQPEGQWLTLEALRAGDPVPVNLQVTAALKTTANPLGIVDGGRTRRFRVSGFTRQFLTYAEQMQLLALLCYGLLLMSFNDKAAPETPATSRQALRWCSGLFFLLFTLGLVLTASRAVSAAFLLALIATSLLIGKRRVFLVTLLIIVLTGGLSVFVITAARQASMTSFQDDSSARRIAYMKAGLRLIPQHPWLGVGMDTHKTHWREWGFPGDYITHTHSTPIQLALDRGLPALACGIWFFIAIVGHLWRSYQRQRGLQQTIAAGLQLGTLGAVLGFTISSLTNYNFGDSEVLLLLLFLVALTLLASATAQKLPTQSNAT